MYICIHTYIYIYLQPAHMFETKRMGGLCVQIYVDGYIYIDR